MQSSPWPASHCHHTQQIHVAKQKHAFIAHPFDKCRREMQSILLSHNNKTFQLPALLKGQVDLELWLVWLTLRQTVKAVKPRQIFGVENNTMQKEGLHEKIGVCLRSAFIEIRKFLCLPNSLEVSQCRAVLLVIIGYQLIICPALMEQYPYSQRPPGNSVTHMVAWLI